VRVLYLSHTGLAEPLGQSQVLPYILGLARRGHEFVVVSFEKPRLLTHLSAAEVRERLPPAVSWTPLAYHRSPAIAATAFDVAHGVVRGWLSRPFDLIHARSTVPALMARSVARAARRPWIFDVRGFLAQEYVDAGHWRPSALRTRITAAAERRLLERASGLVFLTRRALDSCAALLPRSRPATVIPCAVDLGRFARDEAAGQRLRETHELGRGAVMAYAGSLGSWYLAEQMLDFFVAARTRFVDLRFLVLTPQPTLMAAAAEQRGLEREIVAISVPSDQVPRHLSACDFGISFIAPSPSKAASSPTKIAEYLACGLPVVSNAGVGDVESQAQLAPWAVVDRFAPTAYEAAAESLVALLAQPSIRESARAAAERLFSLDNALESYHELYEAMARRPA
jgi:glycosyltransferase involved in cell wall biosynthesis